MASIADVYVTVIPSTSRVAEGIKKAFSELDPEARRAGERWGREIKQGMGDVKPEVKPETTKAKTELEKFRAEQERKKIRQKIEFDEGDFKRKLELMGKEFDGVGGKLASAGKFNLGLTGIGLIAPASTAIANLAGTVQQLAGAGLVIPGIFAGMASTVGTAALGMHGMKDALDAVSKASDGTKASVDAANKALEGLSGNQAEVVKTVSGLKGTFTDLEHISGQNLFAGVSDGLKGLVGNLLPAATRGIDGISRSLNQNLLQAMNSLGSGTSQGFLSRIFGNTASAQGNLTAAINPIVHAVGVLTAAGSDSLPRLATAIGNIADRFNRFISAADGDGRLQKWISEGLDGFTRLGNIALNLGKTFTAITQAAGGGGGLLKTLEDATQKLQTFLNSSAGQQNLMNFFQQGRDMLGQLKDVAVELGPILVGVFQSGIGAANLWLPVIREVLSDINAIPGGAATVVGAFAAWKTISGVGALASSLSSIATLLKVTLPAAAVTGAGSITTALAGISAPAWLGGLLAGGSALAVAPGVRQDLASGTNTTRARVPRLGPDGKLDTSGTPYAPRPQTGPLPVAAPDQYGTGAAQRQRRGAGLDWVGNAPPPAPAATWGPSVPVPPVSTYSPPVVTEAPKGSSSTPNLPYMGTADPTAGYSGYTSDQALLANVPAGRYTQTQGADLTKGLADCSSSVEDLVNLMQGNPTAGRSMATGNAPEWLTAHGFMPGSMPGAFNVGFNDHHMQATLPGGTPFNWGSDAAAARGGVGGTGAFDPAFTSHYYLPVGANPASAAYGDPSGAGTGGLTAQSLSMRNAQERVNDTQHSQEQAEARLNELRAKGTATDRQMEAAEYAVAKAKREHQDAIDGLTVAQDKYNKSATGGKGSNTDAEALGSGFLSGLGQMFGFDGSLFQDPSQFGLFKIFKASMGLKFDPSKAAPGAGQGTNYGAGLPAGGGGGGGLGGLLSAIPQAFGPLQVGSPGAAPGGYMPGMPGGGGSTLLDAVQSSPTGQPGSPGPGNNPVGYQNTGIDLRGASFGDSQGQLSNQISAINSSQNRYGPMLQSVPG